MSPAQYYMKVRQAFGFEESHKGSTKEPEQTSPYISLVITGTGKDVSMLPSFIRNCWGPKPCCRVLKVMQITYKL